METALARIARPGDSAVNLWRVVLDVLTGRRERWNPEEDDTVRYLRTQKAAAAAEAQRLRRRADGDPGFALLDARDGGRRRP